MPGVSASITNAVRALLTGVFGSLSLLVSTKNQFATPPLVIHILDPLMTYSSPFFLEQVRIAAASEPAHGSVTAHDCNIKKKKNAQ